ncbi:TIGR03557 family F420-dependent LLM class oxidoreductase [Flavisphingomonas formosensis]|uniref:TIGR03557 family F420-dependent LLM class oxidoreductase n=1 Tax=Flavisphingomonas formosensis TaxID=861534 RepID=UPI0012FC679F|nr:TIGR03557 family F420-dependent LLM class oxidoreductase [Sphingomonas formosensis]
MTRFGYKLMSEEHGSLALVENARLAEAAGFDFVSLSDHFHPWLDAQGHSPFAWSVLGAIAQATSRIAITTGLTCPIIRYHPAIIAQAAATVALLSRNRFTLAVGAGERLNEHVTGARWPSAPERHAMLAEAIEIFRLLWSGGVHTYVGTHFTVDHARLYDLPDQPIPIMVGVSGPASIALAAERADGIMATEPNPDFVSGFREKAGKDGPRYAEVALAYASSEEEALEMAYRRFSFSAFGWAVNSELPHPAGFEAAARYMRPSDLAESIAAGPDPERHLAAIRKYIDAGYDHVVLTGIGPDQAGFIDFYQRELKPKLGVLTA